jgi:hypothetical protein
LRAGRGWWPWCAGPAGTHLPAKLVRSGVLRAHEPLLEAPIEMAGKLARGRQSCHGVNAGADVRHQVARIGNPPSGASRARLGGQGAASLRCLADRGAIAGWGATDA